MTEDRRNAADESPEISNIFAETPAPRPRDRSGAEDAVAPDPSSRPLPTPAATPERTGAPSPELRRAPAADPSADAAAEAAGKAVLSRRRPPPPGGMPGGLPNRPLPPTAEAAKAGPPPATTANGAPANANANANAAATPPSVAPGGGGALTPPPPPSDGPGPERLDAAGAASRFPARTAQTIGLIALFALVFGFGAWAAFTNIAGAVIAAGEVDVETREQVVQHPDGGVVGEIMVKDGDVVEAGDVLLRFDDTLQRSESIILDGQYWELVARRNRLEAEQFGQDSVDFDPRLIEKAKTDPAIKVIVDGQTSLFDTRIRALNETTEQLRERQAQIARQIEGAEAQATALSRQNELIEQELEGQQRLFDQGLAQLNRLLSLQREQARLQGEVGSLMASIAEFRGKVAEIEIQIVQATTQRQEQAITQVRDIQYQENQVREQLASINEQLSRMEVRAPIAGTVYGSTVFARRAVVSPAQPILYILPSDVEFVFNARIEPIHVDEVYPGQAATLRFSAFNTRTTPEIDGHVVKVSADAILDERTGLSYFPVELALNEGEDAKLDGLTLVPGMPVEAYIKTYERTPLNYLVKPMEDYFAKSLREE